MLPVLVCTFSMSNTYHHVGISLCEHADGGLDLFLRPRRLEVLTGVAAALPNALDAKPETGRGRYRLPPHHVPAAGSADGDAALLTAQSRGEPTRHRSQAPQPAAFRSAYSQVLIHSRLPLQRRTLRAVHCCI